MAKSPLYLRGGIWWARVRSKSGRIERISTKCKDFAAAKGRWRQLERESVSGAHRAPDSPLLSVALSGREEERRSAGRAAGTISMYQKKGRHLVRLLGDVPLDDIEPEAVDKYIAERLKEGAARTSLYKELVTLRGTLKLWKRRGRLQRDVSAIMPLDFAAKYKPRQRALSVGEIWALLNQLRPKRRAIVAFLVATGATYPSEVVNLRKSDIGENFVRLRGTKRTTRDRQVPILPYARPWLDLTKGYVPFEKWTNVRRDLHAACEAAKIPHCSPNDLRRTFGHLLRAQGVEPQLIGPAMGHADGRMVELVYGKLRPEELSSLIISRLNECADSVRDGVRNGPFPGKSKASKSA